MKSTFSQWYDMFNGISLSGFGWNAETQKIEENDQVWDHLIKNFNYVIIKVSVRLTLYFVLFYIMLLLRI